MGFTTDLLTGLARDLAAAGVGVWDTDGAYTAGQTGIVLEALPSEPDAVIVLSAYSVTDDPTLSDSVQGIQVRTRTPGEDPRPTNDLADAIFDRWHNAQAFTVTNPDPQDGDGAVRVVQAHRTSWTPMGADQSRRHERSDNYSFTVHRPSAHRT